MLNFYGNKINFILIMLYIFILRRYIYTDRYRKAVVCRIVSKINLLQFIQKIILIYKISLIFAPVSIEKECSCLEKKKCNEIKYGRKTQPTSFAIIVFSLKCDSGSIFPSPRTLSNCGVGRQIFVVAKEF